VARVQQHVRTRALTHPSNILSRQGSQCINYAKVKFIDLTVCGRALSSVLLQLDNLRELRLTNCRLRDVGLVLDSLPEGLSCLCLDSCKSGDDDSASTLDVFSRLEARARASPRAARALQELVIDMATGSADRSAVVALAGLLEKSVNLKKLTLRVNIDDGCGEQYMRCIARQTVAGCLAEVDLSTINIDFDSYEPVFAAVLREHPLQTKLRRLRLISKINVLQGMRVGDELPRAVSAVVAAREESSKHLRAWRVVREQIQTRKEREVRIGRRIGGVLGAFAHVPFRAVGVITRCVGAEYGDDSLIFLKLRPPLQATFS